MIRNLSLQLVKKKKEKKENRKNHPHFYVIIHTALLTCHILVKEVTGLSSEERLAVLLALS